MREARVIVETPSGPMHAFLAEPGGEGPAPALVVGQEAFGVNHHFEEVCRRFARQGYAALCPELFHRTAPPGFAPGQDFAKAQPHFAQLTNEGILEDLRASLDHLRAHPRVGSSHLGAIGYCLGGFVAWLAACKTEVKAAVSYYGGGIVSARPGLRMQPLLEEKPQAPLLCFFGGQDQSVTPDQVEQIRQRLASLSPENEVVIYPDAGHAFFNDERPTFRKEAAEDSWPRTLAFLTRHLR